MVVWPSKAVHCSDVVDLPMIYSGHRLIGDEFEVLVKHLHRNHINCGSQLSVAVIGPIRTHWPVFWLYIDCAEAGSEGGIIRGNRREFDTIAFWRFVRVWGAACQQDDDWQCSQQRLSRVLGFLAGFYRGSQVINPLALNPPGVGARLSGAPQRLVAIRQQFPGFATAASGASDLGNC